MIPGISVSCYDAIAASIVGGKIMAAVPDNNSVEKPACV